jgi:hypothetical protein
MNRELAIILKLKDEATKELTAFGKQVNDLQPAFKKMALAGTVAFTALSAVLAISTKRAMETESAINRLGHILRTSTDASDMQVNSLIEQAKALEAVGVVSKESTMIAQGQLATFDLQTESIHKLIPSILDYAVAERGASVGSDELRSMTNGLAQALQGQYGTLTKAGFVLDEATKKLISNGTESERVTALVKVLNSTYKGMNASAKETAEGGLIVLKRSFEGVGEAVGVHLLPIITKLTKALVPLLEWITKFIEENPKLTKTFVALGLAIAGLTALIGLAGIAMGVFATSVGIAMLPIIVITAKVIALVSAFALLASFLSDKVSKAFRDQAKIDEEYATKIGGLADKLQKLRVPIEGVAETMKEMADKTAEASKKVSDLNREIEQTTKAHLEAQGSLRQQLANEIIAQEQKVADMQKEILEKTAEIQKQKFSDDSMERTKKLNEDLLALQNNLSLEQIALEGAKNNNIGLETELIEAKRRASMTEFERRVEDINREMAQEKIRYENKIKLLRAELAEAQKAKAELVALEVAYTDSIKKQEAERLQAVLDTTAQIKASMAERAMAESAPKKYVGDGWFSNMGTGIANFLGINDGIVQNGKIITTHPDDYIVATKTPQTLGGGNGVTVNVYGDVSGENLVEEISQKLMKRLRFDTKFAI